MGSFKVMASSSMTYSETQPREDGMPEALPSPKHLRSLPNGMLAFSKSEPSEDWMPNDPSPSAHLMSLPDEVLVHIFCFLPLPDICNNAVRVCSRWKRIGRDYAVYRTITLTDDMIPMKKWDIERSRVFLIIQKAVKLLSFNCWCQNTLNVNLLLEAVAKFCPDLQHLSVPRVGGVSEKSMQTLLVKCSNLSTINICGRTLSNCSDLPNFKYLRVLKFQFNYFKSIEVMTEDRSELFRNIMKGCHSLEELFVHWLLFDDETFRCIVSQTKDRLKALSLTTSIYISESFKQLSSCVLLERLSLINYTLNSTSTIDLSPLKPLRNLKCLKLERFPSAASKGNLRELFAECTFRELRVLTISDCPFGDDELLSQVAASFARLTVLSLEGFQRASDAGLDKLLKNCHMLRSIRLEGLGNWTKGQCFNIHHPSLETVEIVNCDWVEASVVNSLRMNSKLRVRFTDSSLAHFTDILQDMKMLFN